MDRVNISYYIYSRYTTTYFNLNAISVNREDVMKEKTTLKSFVEQIENNPAVNKLPPKFREMIRDQLKALGTINFPIITFKENEWVVATTPVIDVAAQGETENEAIASLKEMIDDYMTDPDTTKPSVKNILNMQITMREIPLSLPISNVQVGQHE